MKIIPRVALILILAIVLVGCNLPGFEELPDSQGQEVQDSEEGEQPETDCIPGQGETCGVEGYYDEDAGVPTPGGGEPSITATSTLVMNSPLMKPVGFVNRGSVPATVMAWTYVPLGSNEQAPPSTATTVTFPPTAPGLWPNSSRFLLLPLGTYTWCYWWEEGDINNDGNMDYSHAFDTRPVVLDENDSDNTELAESVDLSVPPAGGILPGPCDLSTWQILDIRPYIFDSNGIDTYPWANAGVGMGHYGDFVTLRGPITVEYYFQHRPTYDDPFVYEPAIIIVIAAGETHQFYLEENTPEHFGDWDLFVRLVSINR